jgi:protein-tyrosine kinase
VLPTPAAVAATPDASQTPAAAALPERAPVASQPPAAPDHALSLTRTAPVRLFSDAAATSKLVITEELNPQAKEQYRRMAATLQDVQAERGIKVVMITSALAAEGKTLTAANLALTLAESFKRQVALIEADFRCPSIQALFDLNGNAPSIGELFAGGPVPLVQVRPTLAVLAPSDRVADPISALSSPRMRQILEAVRARFDWVVLDTPPVGVLPDANVLSSLVDAVVLVVAAGRTAYPAVQRACQAIGAHRVMGVVLNRADGRALDVAAGGYEHYYSGTKEQ